MTVSVQLSSLAEDRSWTWWRSEAEWLEISGEPRWWSRLGKTDEHLPFPW